MQLSKILLVSLQVVASPTEDEQAIESCLNSKSFDAINQMLASNGENTKAAEYIETLTSQVVKHLTPFITEFLSIQGNVDQDELKKNLFNIAYVRSLLTQLTSCKKDGLKILGRLSTELPNLCKDRDTKTILNDTDAFEKLHKVISDPSNEIEGIDAVANGSISDSAMRKLVLAFMQDFHRIVTSETSVISLLGNKIALESGITGIKRSITLLSWILGGFVILIIAELALLFLHRGKFRQ